MFIYDKIIGIFWFVFVLYWLVSAIGVKKSKSMNWKWFFSRLVLIFILVILFESFPYQEIDRSPAIAAALPALGILGVIICGAGIAFAIWARVYLGKNWGMPMSLKKEPELVTGGPYAYVRHPIYGGVILAMLGSTLTGNLQYLVFVLFFLIYFTYSAKVEERIMASQFPDQYPEYKKRTKMFIPFIL